MTPDELRAELDRLGLSQGGLSRLVAVGDRTVRRWCTGDQEVPRSVDIMLDLLGPDDVAEYMPED